MTTLRKVVVSKYFRPEWVPAGSSEVPTPGGWKEVGEALFHGFGVDYEEFESGPGNFSTAIVEWPDGKVEMVRADKIRFVQEAEAAIAKVRGGDS